VLPGPGYFYAPGRVLVGPTAINQADLLTQLGEVSAAPDEKLNSEFAEAGLGVRAFLVPPDVNIPELITRLRDRPDGEEIPDVSPNHVLLGAGWWNGGPHGEPRNAKAFTDYPEDPEGTPLIAVLDTGYDPAVTVLHPGLAARIDHVTGEDENAVVPPHNYFAQEAGHGTFIDGIIMRVAPGVRIRQRNVLRPDGVGVEAQIILRMKQERAPVINLSLGGYSAGDHPPTGLADAIATLGDKAVVVAAAGNHGLTRPFWPAAFGPVVAVGAVDTTSGPMHRPIWSNYGHWVDVSAPAVKVRSTYLKGEWKLADDPAPWSLGGWAHWGGTSFAAPQVAAEIAKAVQDGLPPLQAAHAVLGSASWHPGIGPVITPVPGVID
jgi:hypothetical protein